MQSQFKKKKSRELFSLVEIDRLILNSIWKCKGSRLQKYLKEQEQIGELH